MSARAGDNPFLAARLDAPRDYRIEWDVPAINQEVSAALCEEVQRLVGCSTPDPRRAIQVLLAAPGYGKTHLFGRIAHQLGRDVLFVFIPQFETIDQPLDHIRFHAVESLFRTRPDGRCALARALARMSLPSFQRYFESLPPSLAVRHQHLGRRIEEGDLDAALEIAASPRELMPFQRFAVSVERALPDLSGPVVRALALGWSPAAVHARRWLRGESLPEEQRLELGLPEEPPEAHQVLLSIAAMLRFEMPLVLCCDQLEAVLVEREEGPAHLSSALMGLLASVPNLLIILSCLRADWPIFLENCQKAFPDRVRELHLRDLDEDQAIELLRRRLRGGEERRGDRDRCWPFDEGDVRAWVRENPLSPRGLIQVCAAAFAEWAEQGDGALIQLGEKSSTPSATPEQAFLDEWENELAAIARDGDRSPDNLQQERLVRAIAETLKLYQQNSADAAAPHLEAIEDGPLPSTKAQRRPSAMLRFRSPAGLHTVVIALTKIATARQFPSYFKALLRTQDGNHAGTVLVHPRSDLPLSASTQEPFDRARQEGWLRTYPLAEHLDAFQRMEGYLTLLDKARGGELMIAGQSIDEQRYRELVATTAVLDGLDLFSALFEQWPGLAAAPPAVAPEPPQPPAIEKVERRPAPAAAKPAAPAPAPEGDWALAQLELVVSKLRLWSLPVTGAGVRLGPTFARLKVCPQGRTTISKIRNKAEDLKIHLGLEDCPLIDSQAGFISIDIRRPERATVALEAALAEPPGDDPAAPLFPVGQDVEGSSHWMSFADPSTCHLLVAGTTGSGKSEFLKAMICALALRLPPEQLQMVLVDPKRVTFNLGAASSPYLACPIAHSVEEAAPLVTHFSEEADRRYRILSERGLQDLGELPADQAPARILLVFDEFADLMSQPELRREFERPLRRLGALGRAAGIHLVLATQRPEASVVTPLLRDNLPARICLKVASEGGSKLILGGNETQGAHLLGRGDLLWRRGGGGLRLQSPYAAQSELHAALRI